MDGERIIAYTEKDLQEKAAQHICARIIKHQKSSSSKFLLGLSPTNGQARRNRAKEVYSAIAEWNEQEVDWGRVLIILLDERYGYENDDDCNASLVKSSLVKTLQKRGIHFPEEQLIAPDTSQGWKEAAAEYQLRLSKILEDGKGFNLVSTGNVDQNDATFQAYYPMYTLPVDSILHMAYPRAHEDLLADQELVIFDQSLGQAMFISHEWSGRRHPEPRPTRLGQELGDLGLRTTNDPYGEQVRVLQEALHHMLHVADTVPVEFASELIFGHDRGMMTSELKSRELFVWFDFFSCPQLEGSVAGIQDVQQQNAIKRSLAMRAWCRLERLASQLHAGEDKYIIEVHSAKHQFLSSPYEFCREPVGEGNFTITSDREVAAGVLHSMFTKRLQFHVKRKEFHSYRILLNLQYSQFRDLPSEPIEDVIPGFCTDDTADEKTLAFRKFMYQNGFEEVTSRDEAGWSPMCYAALRGDPAILQALMQRGASVQDTTTKATPKLFMDPQLLD
eukprot:s980_g26.t1